MRKPVGRGRSFGLAPFGTVARGTEIDEVAHINLGGYQICGLAVLALVWNKYADTVTLDHGNPQPWASQIRLPFWECGYTSRRGQDTVG